MIDLNNDATRLCRLAVLFGQRSPLMGKMITAPPTADQPAMPQVPIPLDELLKLASDFAERRLLQLDSDQLPGQMVANWAFLLRRDAVARLRARRPEHRHAIALVPRWTQAAQIVDRRPKSEERVNQDPSNGFLICQADGGGRHVGHRAAHAGGHGWNSIIRSLADKP